MLGQFLALSPAAFYLHEPVQHVMHQRFQQVTSAETRAHLPDERAAFWQYALAPEQTPFKVHALVYTVWRAIATAPPATQVICIKSVSLNTAIAAIARALPEARVVYICRHPCGRCESQIRQWVRRGGRGEISTPERLRQLGDEWGRVNRDLQTLFARHPTWSWLLFEDLARDPLGEFEALYRRLHLPWSDAIQQAIAAATAAKTTGSFYDTQRDSRQQIDKWRAVLTDEQIAAIRAGTSPYATDLYESF